MRSKSRHSSCMPRLALGSFVLGMTLTSALGGCATDESILNHARQFNEQLVSNKAVQVRHPKIQSYVDRMAEQVRLAARDRKTAISPEESWVFDKFDAVVVLDSQMNAAVSGDDIVRVHSGLLLDLESPDQLLAVLCHEFSHNELRHLKSDINKSRANVALGILAIGGAIAGGNVGRATSAGASGAIVANNLAHRGFSRRDELQADAAGFDLAMRMGIPVESYRRPFEIMLAKYGDGGGGTHPRNSERIRQINELAKGGHSESLAKIATEHSWKPIDAAAFVKPSASLDEFREIQRMVGYEETTFLKGRATALNSKLLKGFKSCFTYNYGKSSKKK